MLVVSVKLAPPFLSHSLLPTHKASPGDRQVFEGTWEPGRLIGMVFGLFFVSGNLVFFRFSYADEVLLKRLLRFLLAAQVWLEITPESSICTAKDNVPGR